MRRSILAFGDSFHASRPDRPASARDRRVTRTACRLASSLLVVLLATSATWAATIELVSNDVSPQHLSLVYEAGTGRVTVDAPDGMPLTAIELRVADGSFTQNCENLGGPFDVCSTTKVFKMSMSGFDRVELGPILPQNVSEGSLRRNLVIDGASVGGGFNQGEGLMLVTPGIGVPEPSSLTLGLLSFLGSWTLVRRR